MIIVDHVSTPVQMATALLSQNRIGAGAVGKESWLVFVIMVRRLGTGLMCRYVMELNWCVDIEKSVDNLDRRQKGMGNKTVQDILDRLAIYDYATDKAKSALLELVRGCMPAEHQFHPMSNIYSEHYKIAKAQNDYRTQTLENVERLFR
jgi:hypothetical protein